MPSRKPSASDTARVTFRTEPSTGSISRRSLRPTIAPPPRTTYQTPSSLIPRTPPISIPSTIPGVRSRVGSTRRFELSDLSTRRAVTQRATLVAARRGRGATATPTISTTGEEGIRFENLDAARRSFTFDSPNHNANDRSNEFEGPQRISLLSYTNSLLRRHRDESPSMRRISPGMRASRSRGCISNSNLSRGSVSKVLEGKGDKYLPKIFQSFNWAELLPMRRVCKKWLEVISTNPVVSDRLGVIVITSNSWEDQLQLFNESPVIWTKFRIEANLFIDLMDSIQLQFWMKHGSMMKSLEIKNKSMTLTGLVEVLSRCPNLSRFLVRWTPEMYPFNAELIKKYYGINFYNGTFANMREISVERSCYLNDNALMSLLKWCGGTLKSVLLTYPPEEEQDPLTRLKPRWTIQPLKNYIDRFGYTGNLQYLDFSWSNISPADMHTLADIDNLSMLKGISLNHCKVDDKSISYFLVRKGGRLEKLEIEDTPLTDVIFRTCEIKQVSVPRLKSLNISGPQGDYQNINFLHHLQFLEEFIARNTSWLDYNKLMPAIQSRGKHCNLRAVDISGTIKVDGTKQIDCNMNRVWFTYLATTLSKVVRLNLNQWTQFGKNDNFRLICQLMPLLEELRLRGWKDVTDSGVTGLPAEKLHSQKNISLGSKEQKERIYVGSLTRLTCLDLSESSITDASIKYGINSIPYLRKFAFDYTQISDFGASSLIHDNRTIDKISFTGCSKMVNKKPKLQRDDGRIIHTGSI